jgi:isoquinoline 1-oxidoreductase alpha subunit
MGMELEINGKHYLVSYPPDTPLLYVLRDELGLTGTKYGCGEGMCGACTVLIAGTARRSCQVPVSAAVSRPITTIEGLEKNGTLHPVQQAFLDAASEPARQRGADSSVPARKYLPLRRAPANH